MNYWLMFKEAFVFSMFLLSIGLFIVTIAALIGAL